MYAAHFNLRDKPFRLVPDPTYLYLSARHEEALGHLYYAVAEGDGFVQLTGEVGTGKTTLLRAFLEEPGENVETAYIFNPRLDSVQLLQAINAEFGADASGETVRELTDALNAFLLEQSANGKSAVLVIDEAQNLSMPVLEQIRLLSNLETTRRKLIQIVLSGQPELERVLASPNLRQLRQRISLSCRLTPFSLQETGNYVQYRLSKAAAEEDGFAGPAPDLFASGALRAIHRFSGGIPRRINIACDRALTLAYAENRPMVSAEAARRAVREIDGGRALSGALRIAPLRALAGVAVIAVAGLAWWLGAHSGQQAPPVAREAVSAPETEGRAVVPEAAAKAVEPSSNSAEAATTPEPTTLPPIMEQEAAPGVADAGVSEEIDEIPAGSLADTFGSRDRLAARSAATAALLAAWQWDGKLPENALKLPEDSTFFQLVAGQAGLSVAATQGGPEIAERLDLPAILVMRTGAESRHGALLGVRGDDYIMGDQKGGRVRVSRIEALQATVTVVFFWKNHYRLSGVLPLNASDADLITLKMLLADIGFTDVMPTPVWDRAAESAVREVQRQCGLNADGLVGPLTKIALYARKPGFFTPHLAKEKSNGLGVRATSERRAP